MRMIATVSGHDEVKRLMICATGDGVYLFQYEQEADGGCSGDLWFETVEDALNCAKSEFDVSEGAWTTIADPLPNCQDDWIRPARVLGRESGNPQWGKLEVLIDGEWIEIMANQVPEDTAHKLADPQH